MTAQAYGSLTFNLLGYQYAWGGVNEAGLSISSLALTETHPPVAGHRPPVDDHFWNQYILDTCATIDDVIASESKVLNTSVGNHHLICDKYGNAVIVEWLGGKTIFYCGERLPVKALTNTIYGRSLNYWRQNWGKTMNSLRYPNGTLTRFCKAADRAQNFKPGVSGPAVDYAFDTLKMVDVPERNFQVVYQIDERRSSGEFNEDEIGLVFKVYCHVSGGYIIGTARWRYDIFQSELPLALEAIRYGDRILFEFNPELDDAPVFIHFESNDRRFYKEENWGNMAKYK